MTGPPSPPDEEKHIYSSIEEPIEGRIASKYTKQALFTPNLSPREWKNYIEDAIDAETDQLFEFLDDFSTASESPIQKLFGHEGSGGYAETASVAAVISSFLSSRQTKSVALGSPTFPSVVSVFDGGEGPCLVLNGLLSPRLTSPSHPHSLNDTTAPLLYPRPTPSDTGGTAAIVAAYAYLHSIRQHLIGTVVLSTISDTEDGHLGTLRHLLNSDERKMLWRGDCMITAATESNAFKPPLSYPELFSSRLATKTIDPASFDLTSSCWQRNSPNVNFTPSRVVTRCATHPVATSLSNNGKRVLGRRPSMDFQTGRQLGSHSRFWTEVGISSFCLGVGRAESSTTAKTHKQMRGKNLAGMRDEKADPEDRGVVESRQSEEQVDGLTEAAEKVKRKQWIQLVKVLVLTVWDQLGLEE
jgi:hypothetical protein